MKRLRRWALFTLFFAGVIFGLSGQWRDPWLWAYVVAISALSLYALTAIGEDLARERYNPPSQGADSTSLCVIRLIAILHIVISALDSGRFHWTSVPASLRAVGLFGFVSCFLLIVRAMTENRFFSAVVRVQTERGHRVIDTGPYAVVRHPGYAGMIVGIPLSGLALGSWAGVAVGLVYSALIFRRVHFEDRFLRSSLDGYDDYARRVPHRLIPGIW